MTKTVKKTKKPWRITVTKVIITVISLAVIGSLTAVSIFAYNVYKETSSFDVNKLESSEPSKMYDINGNLMYTYGGENGKRENVTYNQLPQVLVDAVVATEDSRFFEHNGIDIPRIVKAAFSNLLSHSNSQGGSTITQQVIKKSYFSAEEQAAKSYSRKISEAILAIEATKEVSKEKILELYLNKIYFGRSTASIGIGAASKYYFNKDVTQLTLPEAALLAGTLNSPYSYDPYYNLDKATSRRNIVLQLMVDHGYITKEEAEEAKAVKVENMLVKTQSSSSSNKIDAYVDLVTKEVKKKTAKDPTKVEMKIYTYYDPDIQEVATAYASGEKYNYSDEDIETGGTVQTTLTGRLVAVVGGRNYRAGDLNNATVKNQPGSSVKPFLDYGSAYKYLNWSTAHTVTDEAININGYSPKNWDGNYHGEMTIYEALSKSWNVPAVTTFNSAWKEAGTSAIIKDLENLGIDMSNDKDINLSYAIGGWSSGISPYEMAQVYATIANNGKLTETHTLNYVVDVTNNKTYKVDEDIQTAATASYDENVAYMIRMTMLTYAPGAYSQYFSGLTSGTYGAKSGTSNFKGNKYVKDNKSKDIWMTAYTADYTTSFWMGFTSAGIKKGKNASDYTLAPGKIVAAILKSAKSTKSEFPSKPNDIVEGDIVFGKYPYKLAKSSTPSSKKVHGWFKKDTYPSDEDDSDYGLTSLSSFNASLNSSGQIVVQFAEYSPANAVTDENATEATKEYGKVVYVVEVIDSSSGSTLYTTKLSKASAILNYKPTTDVTITGYYAYEKATDITSNKLSVKVSTTTTINDVNYTVTDSAGNHLSNGSSTTSTTVRVNVTPNSTSNTVTISCNGSSTTGTSATISNLVAGNTYTITVTESNSSSSKSKTLTFKVTN